MPEPQQQMLIIAIRSSPVFHPFLTVSASISISPPRRLRLHHLFGWSPTGPPVPCVSRISKFSPVRLQPYRPCTTLPTSIEFAIRIDGSKPHSKDRLVSEKKRVQFVEETDRWILSYLYKS